MYKNLSNAWNQRELKWALEKESNLRKVIVKVIKK